MKLVAFCKCGGRLCSRGIDSSNGGVPISSSSSSSMPPPLKSAGPLCSCAPPYCQSCQPRDWEGNFASYVVKSIDRLIDISGRVLVQLLVVTKNNDSDIHGAEDGKLVSLLEQTAFALKKSTETAGQHM